METEIAATTAPKFCDIDYVCKVLEVSPSTIYRRIKAGEFPVPCVIGGAKKGRPRKWKREEIDNFFD